MIVEEKPKFTKAQLIIRIALLVLLIAGTFLLILNREKIQHLKVYGLWLSGDFPCFFTFQRHDPGSTARGDDHLSNGNGV